MARGPYAPVAITAGVVGASVLAILGWAYFGLDLSIAPAPGKVDEATQRALDILPGALETVTTVGTLLFGAFAFLITRAPRGKLKPFDLGLVLISYESMAGALGCGLVLLRHLQYTLARKLVIVGDPHLSRLFDFQLLFLLLGAVGFAAYAARFYAREPATPIGIAAETSGAEAAAGKEATEE